MPVSTILANLKDIADFVRSDPGLPANIVQADIDGGAAAAELMNGVIAQAIVATGANADGIITPDDARAISDHIRGNPGLYADFVEGHGDDEGNEETGFHLVQGDGGAFRFQGRQFIDTVADAIYHIGFTYSPGPEGRFVNEDGNQNETVADIAGWLNYFVNGVNVVFGHDGAETLHSGHYSFALDDAANELFLAAGGDDQVWAGDGNDTVNGGDGKDKIGGGDGDDRLYGQAGNDSVWGDGGDDTIGGGTGNDVIGGSDGNDNVQGGQGSDTLNGGDGDDLLRGGAGDDDLWGADGNDTVLGGAGRDTVGGGAGDDRLGGGAGDDTLWGAEGDDTLQAGGGNDEVGGGDGNDDMAGHAGNDGMSGGNGDDTIRGQAGNDDIDGGNDNDKIDAGDGADSVWGGHGDDSVFGGAGDDSIGGGDGNDRLSGGTGADSLGGHDGDDWLRGGADDDELWGGKGADTVEGGAGADLIFGWDGDATDVDTFVFAPGDSGITQTTRDVVEGFDTAEDLIDLTAFGPLDFIGGDAFDGSGPAVRFASEFLEIDSDANGVADFSVQFRWVAEIAETDLLLV
ncbi:hypothetical protein KUH32_01855 [Thalassococcus sp. CAU 1522]|uniref:Hemolysin-type calcium-binding repeat-containing protein n=1 Tax=Thalassococcus arenae TaxID=2851652 RepID=A0ABS6N3B2_9RHOB|nr:calcium-binding protein [Thalassococcus arenae]MBV2358507.1 hypothetical protein [Thalassococcus arenae]